MKVAIIYRKNTDYEREVISYLRDFQRRTGKELEQIDPETRDGAMFCQMHDIVEYPSVLAMDNDGKVLNLWRGTPLPLIDEVSYYVQ